MFAELERELDATARAGAASQAQAPREAFLAGCRAYLEFARRPDFQRIVQVDGPCVLGPDEWHGIDSQLGLPTLEAATGALMAVGVIETQPVKPLALALFGALNEIGFALMRREPGIDTDSALAAVGRILDGLAPRAASAETQPVARVAAPESAAAPPAAAAAEPASPGPAARRLDERLVEQGLAETRTRAQALIRTGRVLVDDRPVEKPGTRVRPGAALRVRGEERRFVSRGGEKLAGALEELGVDPAGRVCLDVGASTGGFTDCLLQAGARRVVAVDVGYGQLHPRLRADPRVAVLERSNFRTLAPARVREAAGAPIELAVMDASFVSATLLLPPLAAAAPDAEVLVLVKPQFEVGRERVGKGGVVREDALRAEAVQQVAGAAEALGYRVAGQAESRLPGPKGNREVFLRLRPRERD